MAKSLASLTLGFLLFVAPMGMAAEAAIPKNLVEAHESLARHFSAADLERVRKMKSEDEMIDLVGLPEASSLTNEWQLWGDSPLARYFKRLGVSEPHDMVGIIAETFWCKVHKRPFALRAKVAELQKHYARDKAMEPPSKDPRNGTEIDWPITHSGRTSRLYLGISKSDGSFWRYDQSDGRGIQRARPEEVQELRQWLEMTKDLR